MTDHNDWSHWRNALAGKKIDTEPGNPRTGYYRSQSGEEVFAIWRDDKNVPKCRRSKFGNGANMSPEAIDEQFGWICHYPITYELFNTVINGGDLPSEYKTRLTTKEIAAGAVWTPELGKKRLSGTATDSAAENPRAVAGDNNPPEDLPPEKRLLQRIRNAAERVDAWLNSIGGTPKTKEEADKVADYATKFGGLFKEADEAFKAEKQPFLDGGREVDAKWRFRSEAEALRKKYLAISDKWIDAEKARIAEEQRRAHEAAKAAAVREAEATGEPIADIKEPEAPKVTVGNVRTVSQRERKVWVVTDPAAFAAYLTAMETVPPDLAEALGKIANRLGAAGVKAPGIELEIKRSAA